MRIIFIFILLANSLVATTPGLKLPVWYDAKLKLPDSIELGKPFSIDLNFATVGVSLQDFSFTLILPEGIEAVGPASGSLDRLSGTTSFHFSLRPAKPVASKDIQIVLSMKTPKEDLQRRVDDIWLKEPQWQRAQLKGKIANLDDSFSLRFSSPVFVNEWEGGFSRRSGTGVVGMAGSIGSQFLLLDLAPLPDISKAVSEHLQKRQALKDILNQPDVLKSLSSADPGFLLSLLDNFQNLSYRLALTQASSSYQEALLTLRESQELLLLSKQPSYEMMAHLRNLEAFILMQAGRLDAATVTLRETVLTMTDAEPRPYLLLNLALLYLHNKQLDLAKSSLNEALRQHPGLHYASRILNGIE